MAARLKNLTYKSSCHTCRATLPIGSVAYWHAPVPPRKRGYVVCVECERRDPETGPEPRSATIRREWDSWSEFVAAASHESKSTLPNGSRLTEPSEKWDLNVGMDGALELAREGWSEVRPEVDRITSAIESHVKPHLKTVFETYYDVTGCEVDVGRFVSGEPENMVEMVPTRISKAGRVITILVNMTYSAGIDGSAVRKRGAAIVALVETLERMQHSTEIYFERVLTASRSGSNKVWSGLVKVKGASDRLDIDTLMFAVAHPACGRRLGWSVEEQEDDKTRREMDFSYLGGYGSPSPLTRADELGADVVLDKMHYLHGSPEGADPEAWVLENLGRFGLVEETAT